VARQAGLPDIILHGTATLGLAVSQVLRREPAGPATEVRCIACRFGGMVRMPSTVRVRCLGVTAAADGQAIRFEALTEDGRPAVRDGLLVTGNREASSEMR
jgi:acyl dehydratase